MLIKAYVSRFKGVMVLSVILTFFVFGIIIFLVSRYAPVEIEKIGLAGRYNISELPKWILDLAGDGLVDIAEDNTIIPALAEKWETFDKGKTWVFYIKNNIQWHDGTKLNAKDIKYNIENVEVSYEEPNKVIFKLSSQFSPFPALVTRPVFKKGLLGTGEWKVVNLSLAGSFVEEMSLVRGNSKKIIRFYPSEDKLKTGYKLGEVDILLDVIDPSPFNKWKTVLVEEEKNENRIVALFFNTESDLFSEKIIRQALNYSVDKESFGFKRALGPIPSFSWAYNSQVKPYNYDLERAKELISSLPQSVKEKIKNSTVNLYSSSVLIPISEKISQYWEKLGIKTKVQSTNLIPEAYDAFLGIYEAPIDPDQYTIWHSTQIESSLTKLKNPRIDKLLEEGRLEIDFEKRKKTYFDFQRFLSEESAAIFLFHPITYQIVRK